MDITEKKLDYQWKINRSIKGGYDSLKSLFEMFLGVGFTKDNRIFDHLNFDEFINGKTIKLLGRNDDNFYGQKVCELNYNKNFFYHISNFYENTYNFQFTNSALDCLDDNFILQGTLHLINNFKNETVFVENEAIEFIKSVLMLLETEIKKSENCKETDNPKLFEKLIYMKNGYIETYNKVFDMYSHYFLNLVKVDFKNNEEQTAKRISFGFNDSFGFPISLDNNLDKEKLFEGFMKPFGTGKFENKSTSNVLKLELENPFPDIFKTISIFNSFIDYKKHIIDPYQDYSYLFQRLLKLKLIHKQTHFSFMDWLFNNNFINETEHAKFKEKESFSTLNNSRNGQRENNFNNIFDI